MRPTSAQIDLSAIAHNVSLLTELAGEAQLCVVVKPMATGMAQCPWLAQRWPLEHLGWLWP